jgi:hypothetical protein
MIFTSVVLAAPDDSAAIRAVIDNQAAAWNRGDIDAFMTGYALRRRRHLSPVTK